MSLQVGQIIENKYRIIRVLGQGGMGAVYEGENTRIHRRVAIKVLHAAVATKADIVQRFEREAQAAGRIGSEHIVEVLDLGNLPSGERFMVMEFLDGEPLSDRIKNQGKLTAGESSPILLQLLTGLGAAHDAGIIHRDLKPDNVFLIRPKSSGRAGPAGAAAPSFVKLVDFGVSKFSALDSESFSMTRTGAVMGTPYYMSPEQARGQAIDHRSDLYSVGVVGYQMITGRVPFNADTFNELLFKIALESPEPAELLAPGLDPHFAQIIMRGMARDPNHRFQSAAEFHQAIEQWCAMNPSAQVVPQARASQAGLGHPALGQSGSGPHAWPRQTAPSLPQVQTHQMLSQSQVALAVTNRESKRSGTLIAIAAAAALSIAGAIAGFKLMGKAHEKTAAATASAQTDNPSTPPATEKTAAEKPATPKQAESPPAADLSASVSSQAAPARASAEPSAPQPVAQASKTPTGPSPTIPTGPTPPKPAPTAQSGGRQINGGL